MPVPTLIAQIATTYERTRGPRIFFWTAMAIWGVLEVRTAIRRAGTDTGEDAGSQRWSLGGTLGGLLAALVIDEVMPEVVAEAQHAPFLTAGGLLVLAGVALRIWSIRTLGRFFTYQVMTTDDQPVVSHGPYRWLRHPSYSALLVSVVGAGVATANPVSLLAAVVIALVGLMRRMSVEEAALARRMGDEYRTFAASRKRLIPGVW
jgi:protein-S-isoprenylcysteine O-methyltransferase Ste14